MEQILKKILATFVVAEYKTHILHVSMRGDMFLEYHKFLDDVYSFFGDQLDPIMEDMEINGIEATRSLAENIKESNIKELDKEQTDIRSQMITIEDILIEVNKLLQEGIEKIGEENNMTVQQNLIDYQKQIQIFERKNRRLMGHK